MNDKEAARRGEKPGGDKKSGTKDLKVRAVLFMEQTPFGELARRAREIISRLEGTMGYRIKVVERVGRSMANQFSQTNLWRGLVCGRGGCITCN